MSGGVPAVFFDRDGTLMEEVCYCGDPRLVRAYPGTGDALRRLKAAGFRTFIITNQSGIGRGLFTLEQYRAVERELIRQLGDGAIDGSYFCADAPGVPSTRRKPEPGMVFEAASEFGLDLGRSWFIGDRECDIECGRRAGTRTVQVATGYGAERDLRADVAARDVVQAIEEVMRRAGKLRPTQA
jgi:D-glycero-D-manno-heptose 1,7-bisphosphate phosphatase